MASDQQWYNKLLFCAHGTPSIVIIWPTDEEKLPWPQGLFSVASFTEQVCMHYIVKKISNKSETYNIQPDGLKNKRSSNIFMKQHRLKASQAKPRN